MADDREELIALRRLAELEAKASQSPVEERSGLEKAVNLGASYVQGRTWGAGPKIAAGLGAPIAKAALEGRELITGQEAPPLNELYKKGVDIYSAPAEHARQDNPILSTLAELAGGIKTGVQVGGTQAAKNIGTGIASRSGNLAQKMGLGPKSAELLGRALSGGLVAEGASRAYQAAEAPVGDELKTATEKKFPMAGILGAGGVLAGAGINALSGKMKPVIAAEKKKVIELAKKHNIPLSLDKLTDSKFYQTLISEGENVPFSGSAKRVEKVQKALNRAVSKTFGQDADSITPEVIADAYDDLGSKFQAFTKDKVFEPKEDFFNSIEEIKNQASRGHYGKDGADFLQANLDRINELMDETGKIKGDRLDKLRKEFAELSRKRYDDIGNLADDLESAIVEIIKGGDKNVGKELTKVKYQYKNLKTIQRIALKDQVDGDIRPALLTQAVKAKFGEDAFAKGKAGDLGELARIGQLVKSDIPNSGTTQRRLAQGLLTGNTLGVIPTYAFGGPLAALGQAGLSGAAMGANRALQARNYNPEVIEQALSGALIPYGEMSARTPITAAALANLLGNK